MRGFLYFALIGFNLPLLLIIVKTNFFFRAPLFSIYFLSIFFLNILGSAVVFFSSLNIYGGLDLYTIDFFYILLIQTISFYFLFPLFYKFKRNNINYINVARSAVTIKALIYLACFTLAIIGLFYLKYDLPPFYTSNFSGGNTALINARSDFFENTGQMWFYRIGFYILPQLAGITIYLIYRRDSNLKSLTAFFGISFLASILALSFLHKTPVALYWISILLAKVIYEGKANISLLVKWLVGILSLIVIWYLVYFPGQEASYYLDFMARSILNRIFGVYPISLAYVPLIVDNNSFFYGTTMINPFGMFPYEIVNLSKMIHMELFSLPGYAPPPAMGYAYADFGLIGVFITSLFIGLYLFVAQFLLAYIKNRVLKVVLTVYLSLKVIFLSMSSASEILLNPGEIVTLFIILSVVFLSSLKISKC